MHAPCRVGENDESEVLFRQLLSVVKIAVSFGVGNTGGTRTAAKNGSEFDGGTTDGFMMRACLSCGRPCDKSYCSAHYPKVPKAPKRLRGYDYRWVKLSKSIRDTWVAEHGNVCPGTPWCNEPGVMHESCDLTVDHDDLAVMCRSANSRKAAIVDRPSDKLKGGDRQLCLSQGVKGCVNC